MRWTSMLNAVFVMVAMAIVTGAFNTDGSVESAHRVTMGGVVIYILGMLIDTKKDIEELKDAKSK